MSNSSFNTCLARVPMRAGVRDSSSEDDCSWGTVLARANGQRNRVPRCARAQSRQPGSGAGGRASDELCGGAVVLPAH